LLLMQRGSELYRETEGRGRMGTDASAGWEILHQGWLRKESDIRKKWKYRYCVLCSDGQLRYYSSDGEGAEASRSYQKRLS
jgi:hypothetical protein